MDIHPDIAHAQTLPGWIYSADAVFEAQRQQLFESAWHAYPGDVSSHRKDLLPWLLGPGSVDEPLLITHVNGTPRVISNVCTHRGATLVETPTCATSIRCPYHGRRFDLEGRLKVAPGFEDCPGFPTETDHLMRVATGEWEALLFASLAPRIPFDAWFSPVQDRMKGIIRKPMRYHAAAFRRFRVAANWMLYCDNYLEGFHIPFVHPSLHSTIKTSDYTVELFSTGSLQIASPRPGEPTLTLPPDHVDAHRPVAAYYFWLFPTTMINVYPWGLSINVVLPQSANETEVIFFRFVWDDTLHETGAGQDLEQVEREDEAVLERVARGIRSKLYHRGRYAPQHERAVHHFHRLLTERFDFSSTKNHSG